MARSLLEEHACWDPHWQVKDLESGYDPDARVPFHGRKAHYDNAS